MNVLVLRKQLDRPPESLQAPGVAFRPFLLPDDAAGWLALRERAFAKEDPPVRAWTIRDLEHELGGGRGLVTWLACPVHATTTGRDACGALSLSPPVTRGEIASLHWLIVDPAWRRRGIGASLLGVAERYCWNRGWHELRLETHRNWDAAVQFYKKHGFQ